MNKPAIRATRPGDLPAIEAVENRCFRASRRSSLRSLRHSLQSSFQSVWVAIGRLHDKQQVVGVIILHHHPVSLRIYSLAVLPAFRGSGTGRRLVQHALAQAKRAGLRRVTLEADRRNKGLIRWYERFGFRVYRVLENYYSPGRHAVRMKIELGIPIKSTPIHDDSRQDQTSESTEKGRAHVDS